MGEFEIRRAPESAPMERNVGSSEHTDSDGGGGTSFVFYGKAAPEEEREPEKKRKGPPPVMPPVDLELSPEARVGVMGQAENSSGEGTEGMIGGKVKPPASLAEKVREVRHWMEMFNGEKAPPPNLDDPGLQPGKESGKHLDIKA